MKGSFKNSFLSVHYCFQNASMLSKHLTQHFYLTFSWRWDLLLGHTKMSDCTNQFIPTVRWNCSTETTPPLSVFKFQHLRWTNAGAVMKADTEAQHAVIKSSSTPLLLFVLYNALVCDSVIQINYLNVVWMSQWRKLLLLLWLLYIRQFAIPIIQYTIQQYIYFIYLLGLPQWFVIIFHQQFELDGF